MQPGFSNAVLQKTAMPPPRRALDISFERDTTLQLGLWGAMLQKKELCRRLEEYVHVRVAQHCTLAGRMLEGVLQNSMRNIFFGKLQKKRTSFRTASRCEQSARQLVQVRLTRTSLLRFHAASRKALVIRNDRATFHFLQRYRFPICNPEGEDTQEKTHKKHYQKGRYKKIQKLAFYTRTSLCSN